MMKQIRQLTLALLLYMKNSQADNKVMRERFIANDTTATCRY